jgi:hypothetical protein
LIVANREVPIAGSVDNPYSMPYETHLLIVVARDLKVTFDYD